MIDKLEYLLALARERHFGRAATACGVTQPTLSAGLRQLEEQLGAVLVDRGSRFHGLTAEGERTLVWARRIVADARALRDEIAGAPDRLAGQLRLGVIPSALPMVAALTTPFRARHPGVGFSVLSRASDEILGMLDGLQLDAGITYLDNEPLGRVRAVPLYRERYCLVAAASDLAGLNAGLGAALGAGGPGATVTWADAARIPLCLLTPDMQNRRIIDARLHAGGGRASISLESNSMVVLMTHVGSGAWASVMSVRMAQAFDLPAHIRIIPIDDPGPIHTIGLVYPERDPTSPATAALVAIARESMDAD